MEGADGIGLKGGYCGLYWCIWREKKRSEEGREAGTAGAREAGSNRAA